MSVLDSVFSEHLDKATVFKDEMLQVCRNEIADQITKYNFLAVEADETTDSFNQQQFVIIFRYVPI